MASEEGGRDSDKPEAGSSAPPTPLRQDQVQNAVAFLRHPKVRDSSIESKRSFLERKGLTTAEIDAAFQNAERGVEEQVGASVPSPVAAPRAYSWSKAFMGLTVVAAGIYAIQNYAIPWVREWTKRKDPDEVSQSKQNQSKLETYQELKQYCGSMERSMQEMTMEIRTLCSKIDMLSMESRRDSQQRDIQEIKFLLNGLAEAPPSAPMSPGTRNTLWTPGASPRSTRPISTNAPQGLFGGQALPPTSVEDAVPTEPGVEAGNSQAEYMNVLGLLANGQNLPQHGGEQNAEARESSSNGQATPWGRPSTQNGDNAGGMSQGSHGEIQAESTDISATGTSSAFGGSAPNATKTGTNAWKPPPLPEATINVSSKKTNEET